MSNDVKLQILTKLNISRTSRLCIRYSAAAPSYQSIVMKDITEEHTKRDISDVVIQKPSTAIRDQCRQMPVIYEQFRDLMIQTRMQLTKRYQISIALRCAFTAILITFIKVV